MEAKVSNPPVVGYWYFHISTYHTFPCHFDGIFHLVGNSVNIYGMNEGMK